MKGCRSWTEEEIKAIRGYFDGRDDRFALRDKTLVFLLLYTGLRIHELLSIRLGDVWENHDVPPSVYISKENMKGQAEGRRIILNFYAQDLLRNYFKHYDLDEMCQKNKFAPLFFSRAWERGLTMRTCIRIVKKAMSACGLETKRMGTHCARKTFAKVIYEKVNHNLLDLSVAMGHKSVNSTKSYVNENNDQITTALQTLTFNT